MPEPIALFGLLITRLVSRHCYLCRHSPPPYLHHTFLPLHRCIHIQHNIYNSKQQKILVGYQLAYIAKTTYVKPTKAAAAIVIFTIASVRSAVVWNIKVLTVKTSFNGRRQETFLNLWATDERCAIDIFHFFRTLLICNKAIIGNYVTR